MSRIPVSKKPRARNWRPAARKISKRRARWRLRRRVLRLRRGLGGKQTPSRDPSQCCFFQVVKSTTNERKFIKRTAVHYSLARTKAGRCRYHLARRLNFEGNRVHSVAADPGS